jgi:hypothetical protein
MPQLIDLGRIRLQFLGNYGSGTAYSVNSVVRYNNSLYVYINASTTTGNVPTNTTYWSLMLQGFNFENAWSVATEYQINDIVTFGPKTYRALSTQTGNDPSDATYWEILTSGINATGNWSAATTKYFPGDIATRGANQYITNSYHTPNATFSVDLAAGKWAVFASGFRFRNAWAPNTVYLKDDLVTNSLNSYIATQDFTSNGSSFGAETAGNWTLFTPGTDNLPAQAGNADKLLVTNGTNVLWTPTINLSSSAQVDGSFYMGDQAIEIATAESLSNLIGFGVGDAGGSSEEFTQFTIWNKNADGLASTDVIAQTHDGTDLDGFIDMGITGENFDAEIYGITGPNDGYIFMVAPEGTAGEGNLVLATGDTGTANKIVFAAGGLTSGTTQMEITPDENVHIEIDTPSTSPSTGALTVVGGVGVQGNINVAGNAAIQGNQSLVGNLVVQGSLSVSGGQFATENLSSTDPLLFVGDQNEGNEFDLGFLTEAKQPSASVTFPLGSISVSASVAVVTSRSYTATVKELTSNVATLNIGAHNYVVGDTVNVTGVDATFNGSYTVTAVTVNTISYAKTASNVAQVASDGSVQILLGTSESIIAGDFVTISGITGPNSVFNGVHHVTAVSSTTFSFSTTEANQVSTSLSAASMASRSTRSKYSGIAKNNTDGAWYLFSNLETRPTTTIDFTTPGLVFDKLYLGSLDVVTASDLRGAVIAYSTLNVFASTAARDAAIASPVNGSYAYRTDAKVQEFYTGTKWEAVEQVVSPLLAMALL